LKAVKMPQSSTLKVVSGRKFALVLSMSQYKKIKSISNSREKSKINKYEKREKFTQDQFLTKSILFYCYNSKMRDLKDMKFALKMCMPI